MNGFNIGSASDIYYGGNLVKWVYIGNKKVWDYKTPPVYTAPTAKAGLVYNGSAQALLNAGSTSHGTILYSSDGSTWGTSIPTRTNASNAITVYWRLVGDGRHNDVGPTEITTSIARSNTASASASNKTYNGTTDSNGTAQTGVTGSNVSWSGTTSATNAGIYTAYATPTSNYAWSDGTYGLKTINWSMYKRGLTAPVLNGASVTYPNMATASVKTAGTVEGGTATAPGTLIWTNQSRLDEIGSQTATAYYAATTNFSASPMSAGVTVQVSKYTPTLVLSCTDRVYNGNPLYATASITAPSGGASMDGTIYYGTSNGATTYSVTYRNGSTVNLSSVYQTNVGSLTVYAYFVPDSMSSIVYNQSSSYSKTFTVSKKDLTITAKAQTITYGNSIATGTGQVTTSGLVSGDSLMRVTLTASTSNVTTTGTITPSSATTAKGIANYSVTYATGTLTVTARAVTATATDEKVTYDGSSHSASNTGTTTNLPSGHTATYTCTGSTTSGEVTKTLTNVVIKNGNGTDVTSSFTITKVNGKLSVGINWTIDAYGAASNTAGIVRNSTTDLMTPTTTRGMYMMVINRWTGATVLSATKYDTYKASNRTPLYNALTQYASSDNIVILTSTGSIGWNTTLTNYLTGDVYKVPKFLSTAMGARPFSMIAIPNVGCVAQQLSTTSGTTHVQMTLAGGTISSTYVEKATASVSNLTIPSAIYVGGKLKITGTPTGDGTMEYYSTHPQYANVDQSGVITGYAAGGTAEIYAVISEGSYYGSAQKSGAITVSNLGNASITLSTATLIPTDYSSTKTSSISSYAISNTQNYTWNNTYNNEIGFNCGGSASYLNDGARIVIEGRSSDGNNKQAPLTVRMGDKSSRFVSSAEMLSLGNDGIFRACIYLKGLKDSSGNIYTADYGYGSSTSNDTIEMILEQPNGNKMKLYFKISYT